MHHHRSACGHGGRRDLNSPLRAGLHTQPVNCPEPVIHHEGQVFSWRKRGGRDGQAGASSHFLLWRSYVAVSGGCGNAAVPSASRFQRTCAGPCRPGRWTECSPPRSRRALCASGRASTSTPSTVPAPTDATSLKPPEPLPLGAAAAAAQHACVQLPVGRKSQTLVLHSHVAGEGVM